MGGFVRRAEYAKDTSMQMSNVKKIGTVLLELKNICCATSVHSVEMVGRLTNAARTKKKNLAKARRNYLQRRQALPKPVHSSAESTENGQVEESSGDEIECVGWSGGTVHWLSSDDEPITISDSESEDEEVEELTGIVEDVTEVVESVAEVVQGCSEELDATSRSTVKPSAYSTIAREHTARDWKKAESCRSLGYNGRSERTRRFHEQSAREKEKEDAKLRNRSVHF